MAIECGTSTLIAEGYFGGVAQKVHCRKTSCEECAPILRSQLIARGCNGKPNRHIVWTSRVRADQTPEEACVALKAAMARVILHARRRLKVKPEVRWKLRNDYKSLKRELQVIHYAKEDDAAGLTEISYLWTTEATKQGWPHLHMVARGPYIPHEWLKEQMADLLDSPNVWVNAIHNVQQKIGYIVSYITKEEHRFGTGKRYSFSRNFKLPPDQPWQSDFDPTWARVVVKRLVEQVVATWTNWNRDVHQRQHGRFAWGDPYDPMRPDADAPTKTEIVDAILAEHARDAPSLRRSASPSRCAMHDDRANYQPQVAV